MEEGDIVTLAEGGSIPNVRIELEVPEAKLKESNNVGQSERVST